MQSNKNGIVLISLWFGPLPEHFPAFLISVEFNPNIDFLFVTDQEIDNVPKNFRVLNITFSELRNRIQDIFDFEISLDRPYKLCDFKPIYAVVFKNEISEYDYWGHCDVDMIFGDVYKFISKTALNKFDKIYQLGHLTLYRNTEENNQRFKTDLGWLSYKQVFSNPKIYGFDEIAGMQNIFNLLNVPTYLSRDYADITWGKVRFTLSYFHIPENIKKNNNYEKQVFYWENGCVFRAYLGDDKTIKKEEFNYIHFSKRKMPINCRIRGG